MNRASLAALLSAVTICAVPVSASAQVLDLSTLSCSEFFEGDEGQISHVIMWLDGYYSDEEAAAVVDFDAMKDRMEALGVYCGQNPEHGLITAADEVLWE